MARILWLNWSGGGNLPPSLGIARAAIRSAGTEVLGDSSFRDEARRRAAALAGVDGASRAAVEIEALVTPAR